jgi:hypothetical protein
VFPDLLEDERFDTPTPADVYGFRYSCDETALAVLQRLERS